MIRPETPADYPAIRALHRAAFAPSVLEAQLVDELRATEHHVPDLCLVHPYGHVMTSRATVAEHPALAVGPIAVDPGHQRRGIGGALIHAVIERARATDYPLIGLLGHPSYYPRFGFQPGAELGIATTYDVPPDAWMVLTLPGHAPAVTGTFRYAPPFP